jgi:hypothetical protein
LTTCSVLNEYSRINYGLDMDDFDDELSLYSDSIKHLSIEHKRFFFKWYEMLEFEFNGEKQFESGEMTWWKSTEQLESEGWTVLNLQLLLKKQTQDKSKEINYIQFEGEDFYLFDFRRTQS